MSERVYLTTTLPYVNADPHLGFALELVQTDVMARYHRLQGDEVFFNTGTDEHGAKIYRQAVEAGESPPDYVNAHAAKFAQLKAALNVGYDSFLRTTDPKHIAAAQEFWRRCDRCGDIYKKNYRVKYCVGCELEKIDSELTDGRCAIHPNLEIELIEEENYFFKFSKYRQSLLDLYNRQPDFIVPNSRLNEIKKFVERGLDDFSISRLKTKMPWGVSVPDDSAHVMYVWFDALVSYISALGWPDNTEKFTNFWGTKEQPKAIQFAGKDNLRQQAAMWQAMLMSAGLPASQQIVIHGFITSQGHKMSKSLGNVVDPFKLVEDYGTDAVRYYLLRHVHPFEDSDFTLEKFKEAYNAHLANGLGNLVNRVMKMSVDYNVVSEKAKHYQSPGLRAYLDHYQFSMAMDKIWAEIKSIDDFIQTKKPFNVIKTDRQTAQSDIETILILLAIIADHLLPFMPQTGLRIKTLIQNNTFPSTPLFPRKE